MMLLGPPVELLEHSGELAAPAAEAVTASAVALEDAGVDELSEPCREDRGADPGALTELGEGEGAAPKLPDQPQSPAATEEVKCAFYRSGGGHWY